jgi:soluble lytic murein transglycosylase
MAFGGAGLLALTVLGPPPAGAAAAAADPRPYDSLPDPAPQGQPQAPLAAPPTAAPPAPAAAAPASPPTAVAGITAPPSVSAPPGGSAAGVPEGETATLRAAVEAALGGDLNRAFALKAALSAPLARRLVDFVAVDSAGSMMSLESLRQANADLMGWPRPGRRRAALEKALEPASAPPSEVLRLFAGSEPATAQGAMALAAALEAQGRRPEAEALIRRFWRTKMFEADQQALMRSRFGGYLTPLDDAQRLSMLLYGPQGPATKAMLDAATPEMRALAEARIALRADRSDAPALVDLVPAALKSDPGLAFDRSHYLRKRDLDVLALGLAPELPQGPAPTPEIGAAIWTERRALMTAALKAGDYPAAYAVVANHGFAPGSDYAEAEFFAGWLALTRQHDPALAESHFARLAAAVTAPISVARAEYWRGRAAAALGLADAANAHFANAAQYDTTFYGQLAAEKIGRRELVLGRDPVPLPSDRAAFAEEPLIQAARLLHDAGERDLMRTFVLTEAERPPRGEVLVLLLDLLRGWGEQDLAMRAARGAAQKGYVLPERAYPLLPVSAEDGSAEPAFMLSIARQESNFDPTARSGPGALGLMQLKPATAQVTARRLGVAFSAGLLREPGYNLRLGGAYLGHLVDVFGGSYLLASAGYNAGPSRPSSWTAYCGDPRATSVDPVDFIECIPFSETRNYVMRTLETMEVYRARLNGGRAPLTLAEDLRRGAWGADAPPPVALPSGPVPYTRLSVSGLDQ